MGLAAQFTAEKLFSGILFHDKIQKDHAIDLLIHQFGPIDHCSKIREFSSFSPYYDQEMSGAVYRVFVSFSQLVDPSTLVDIKVWTNAREQELSAAGQRMVNLDPGLISAGRIALATTKNASHRIALQQGIYAEITLFYAKKDYHPLPWTYPDFKDVDTRKTLLTMRQIYMQQLKDAS